MGINRNTITKGGDATVVVPLSTCSQPVDLQAVENLTCSFYTEEGGQAIERELADFVIDGDNGITLLRWQELDQLPDGVIRYTVEYDYEGEHIKVDQYTNYFLKTAPGYIPMDFVSKDEVDAVVASAITSSAGTEVIEHIIEEAGYVNEDFVNSAITQATSGLASEEYVEQIVAENDWRFIIHSEYGQYPTNQDEVNAAVEAALTSLNTEGRPKMVLYYRIGESYYPFYSLAPYRPHTDYEAYFWCIWGYPQEVRLVRLGLSRNQLPTSENMWQETYNLAQFISGNDFRTINGGNRLYYAGQGDINTDNTFIINGTGDTGGGMTVWNELNRQYEQNPDNVAKVHIMFKDWENRVPDWMFMTVEVFNPGENGGFSAQGVACGYMQPSNQIKKSFFSYEHRSGTPVMNYSYTIVNFDDFATTAQTADFVTSAQTESIVQSAITASNLVYAVSSTNKIWAGSREAYSAQTIDNTTLYFITN